MIGGSDDPVPTNSSGGLTIDIFMEPPGGRDVPFEPFEGGFTSYDASIGMIEVNQGLSYGFDTDTGEFYLMDNFVAGKETAVFVSMTEPPNPKSEIKLEIEKDGVIVATLFPELTYDPNLLLFQPRDMAEVNNWEQGAYTFRLTIDDKYAERTTNFFRAMPIKVLGVPVLAHYSGRVVPCEGEWQNGGQLLTGAFPVGKADVEYVLGPELDLSDAIYDLDTASGRQNVWRALCRMQTPNEDYTLIVGFVREAMFVEPGRTWKGFTCGKPANVVCESDYDMTSIVLHEISHCYKIGDEYPRGSLNPALNSPPYQMEGINIFSREPDIGVKDKVTGGQSIGLDECGSIIYEEQRAYMVEERRFLGTVTSYMGWQTGNDPLTRWISSDIWNHLFRAFTGQLTGKEPGFVGTYIGQCYSCYGDVLGPRYFVQCKTCSAYFRLEGISECTECKTEDTYYMNELLLECTTCNTLIWHSTFEEFNTGDGSINSMESIDDLIMITEITGWIDTDGSFDPDPWYSYLAPPGFVTANKNGEYSARVIDDKGKEVCVVFFDAVDLSEATELYGTTSVPDARIPINIVVKFPSNAAKVVIMRGDREIYTRNVSAHKPTVAFTGLDDYQDLPDRTTITWEASDADGDDLTFELWYCTSNMEEYFMVATGLTGRSHEVNLSTYPGSEGGYFYIYATDGINTAEKNSPYINKPFIAPVILTEQKEITKVKITEAIYYPVEIYDAQDGWLGGNSVSWILNGEEVSITHALESWPYMLDPGTYTFTCIATNSAGLSTEKDFRFEILNDESDLPNDEFREDIKYALANNYIVPVSRLDAPITRGELSEFGFMLYYWLADPDSLAFYDAAAIKDSEKYGAFFMDYLGVMEAQDGYFYPNNSMTQREAMLVMYQVATIATNPGMTLQDLVYTEEGVLEWFISVGVIDASGENVFQPDEKMSRKLALVRIARLDKMFFPDE